MQKLLALAAFAVIISLFVVSPSYGQTLGTSATVPAPYASASDTETGLFTPAAHAVAVTSAGTEKMRVNATGVGIGTTTVASKFEVNGNGSIGYVDTAAPTNGLLVKGDVGIGTTAPSEILQISGSGNITPIVQSTSGAAAAWRYLGSGDGWQVGSDAGGVTGFNFLDEAADVVRMTINNSGDVGIGTTIMTSQLEVNGNALVGYVDTAAPTNGLLVKGDASIGTTNSVNPLDVYGAVAIGTSYAGVDTAPTNGLIVQGAVGIGTTSSSAPLQVYDNETGQNAWIIIETGPSSSYAPRLDIKDDRTSGHDWQIVNGGYASSLTFQDNTANITAMILENTGNVGIGNTGPDYLLHVGSASATGVVVEFQNSSGACTHNPGASSETVSCSSDVRLKEDIQDADSAFGWIDDMRIRDFTIKATGEQATGVIAQEMLPNHPDMVHLNPEGYYAVEEPNPWKLVKAIQELHKAVSMQNEMLRTQRLAIDEIHHDFEAYKETHH